MESGLCLCAKVSYVKSRPRLPLSLFYKLRDAQRANKPTERIIDRIIYLSFLHKSEEWAYEQEARIFSPFKAFEQIHFHRSELVGVILGPKSSRELEEQIRKEIQQHTSSSLIERASLASSNFGITIPANFARWNADAA
jgi:hypothetical protein